MNWWYSFILGSVVGAIRQVVKNEESKAKMKKVLLDIHMTIKAIYADDPDFQ